MNGLRFHVVRIDDLPADPVAMFATRDAAYAHAADLNDALERGRYGVLDVEPPSHVVPQDCSDASEGWSVDVTEDGAVISRDGEPVFATGGIIPDTASRDLIGSIDGCVLPSNPNCRTQVAINTHTLIGWSLRRRG